MERLTFVTEDGEVLFHPEDLPDDEGMTITQLAEERQFDALEIIAERLANREQAEEQGLLLRLPCKVGDILYFAHHDRVISSEVLSVKYHVEAENHGIFIRERLTIDVEGISTEIDFCEIGKTVFLTEAEAGAKLAEMEGVSDGSME